MAESGTRRLTPHQIEIQNTYRTHLRILEQKRNNIVPDGILYNRPKDPPGQRSHYIQPGATETEVYRITTFKNFPNHVPVDPMVLAKYGFYFTGYKDRVKCFSCSLAVQDWSTNDNPRSTKWHFEDCNLVRGTETRNVQISKLVRRPLEFVRENTSSGVSSDSGYGSVDFSLYNNSFSSTSSQSSQSGSNGDVTNITTGLSGVNLSENNHSSSAPGAYQTATVTIPQKLGPYGIEGLDVSRIASEKFKKMLSVINLLTEEGRRKSFKIAIAPSDHFKSLNHELLAKSGFYYLGDHDRTQCFSCSGVLRNWRSTDVPDNEHKNHFPNCKLVNNNEPRNVPIGSELTIAQILKSPPNPSPEEQQRLNVLFPCTNPTNSNMRSYENRLRSFTSRWDKTKVKATIELIAEAGFFYLGDRDRAKCFYCNGGLQNWDPDDEPWTEHAKWFPGCEFILRSKGIEFAREMFLKYPDMPRLKIRNERREYQPGFATQSAPLAGTPRMTNNREVQSAGAVLNGLPAMPQGLATSAPQPQAVADRVPQQNILPAPFSQIQRIKTQAMDMGFTNDAITKAIQNRAARGNGEYTEVQQMLDDLFSIEETARNTNTNSVEMANVEENSSNNNSPSSSNQQQQQQQQQIAAQKRNIVTSNDQTVKRAKKDEAINQELLTLEKERLCKICSTNQADAVVIPCGHLSFCSTCVAPGKRCQLCRRKIDQVIKVFVA